MSIFSPLLQALVLSASAASSCADGEPAKITLKPADTPFKVFVCGFENTEQRPAPGFLNLSEVKVTTVKDSEEPKVVLEGSALDTYWIKKEKGRLLVDEVWFLEQKQVPAVRRELSCTSKACKLSKPKCVLKTKKNPYPKALKEWKEGLKNATLDEADKAKLISHIFAQGLSGDASARAFFLNQKMPPIQGEAAEEWRAGKAQLYRARKVGCGR